MAMTQKKINEEIKRAKGMIDGVVLEKEEVLGKIRQKIKESNKIDVNNDEEVKELLDEHNGLMATIQYYTGSLNTLEWVLKEMKTKKDGN